MNTCNDICYIESGYNSLSSIVKLKQRNYFVKIANERYGLQDDPLGFALRLVLNNTYKTSNYLNNLIVGVQETDQKKGHILKSWWGQA